MNINEALDTSTPPTTALVVRRNHPAIGIPAGIPQAAVLTRVCNDYAAHILGRDNALEVVHRSYAEAVEHSLLACVNALEASNLGATAEKQFRQRFRFANKQTFSHRKRTGERAAALLRLTVKMPDGTTRRAIEFFSTCWTVLHRISLFSDEEIVTLIRENRLTRHTKREEIEEWRRTKARPMPGRPAPARGPGDPRWSFPVTLYRPQGPPKERDIDRLERLLKTALKPLGVRVQLNIERLRRESKAHHAHTARRAS
jgi:hypothetical protein